MSEELIRPCPFCGNMAKVRTIMEKYPADSDHPAGEYDAWHEIGCDECGVKIGGEYASEALEGWNKRGAPKLQFTSYADVPEPLPMEAEIWAAGADPETARFVAKMLGDQGYVLVLLEDLNIENIAEAVWETAMDAVTDVPIPSQTKSTT